MFHLLKSWLAEFSRNSAIQCFYNTPKNKRVQQECRTNKKYLPRISCNIRFSVTSTIQGIISCNCYRMLFITFDIFLFYFVFFLLLFFSNQVRSFSSASISIGVETNETKANHYNGQQYRQQGTNLCVVAVHCKIIIYINIVYMIWASSI